MSRAVRYERLGQVDRGLAAELHDRARPDVVDLLVVEDLAHDSSSSGSK